jgi:hypothetical protein
MGGSQISSHYIVAVYLVPRSVSQQIVEPHALRSSKMKSNQSHAWERQYLKTGKFNAAGYHCGDCKDIEFVGMRFELD